MNGYTACAVVFLALAMWLWPGPEWVLRRIVDNPDAAGEPVSPTPDDPFAVAAAFELFAMCLRAGLPVETAAAVVADCAPAAVGVPLATAADLLALGAEPERAWATTGADGPTPHSDYAALATMARRSARSGASLSDGLDELADSVRRRAHDEALERAERAGVAISGPLGLCFLPAFVCLGIVPVVIGLASSVLGM